LKFKKRKQLFRENRMQKGNNDERKTSADEICRYV
jgi:hypothetical protein